MSRHVRIQLIRGQAQGTGDEFSGAPLDTLPSNHGTSVAAICGPCHMPAPGLSVFMRYLVNSLASTSLGDIQRNQKSAGYSPEPRGTERGFRWGRRGRILCLLPSLSSGG